MSGNVHRGNFCTMDDLARELGVSKSTVSRALSDSNRISVETVRRVKDCAREHGFRPNLVAKALAGKSTLNIAAVMPREAAANPTGFFYDCLSGMVSRAEKAGYNILICMSDGTDTDSLESIIQNRKADAVILMQPRRNDVAVSLLKAEKIPFVAVGAVEEEGVVQVDSRISRNCADFTKLCAAAVRPGGRILFVCGTLDVIANSRRLSGFLDGMAELPDSSVQHAVCYDAQDLRDDPDLRGWDLILFSDDVVCVQALGALERAGITVGKDVMVASFHDSVLLETHTPPISALRVDAFSLGETAVTRTLSVIAGETVAETTYIDCSYQMRLSTGRVLADERVKLYKQGVLV